MLGRKEMRNLLKSEQSGRSMIEMLGVLAIIGVLSVGGIAGYSKAMAKFKTNKTLDQLSMLITNIRTMYSNQTDYTGLNNAQVIALELASQDMIRNATLVNPFQGAITVAAAAGANPLSFLITYTGIDNLACITVATADWGGAPSSGLVSISLNGTAHTWGGGAGKTFPIDLATATTDCKGANGVSTLIFEYH